MLFISAFKNWKNLSGRARRLEFGQVFVICFIVFTIISFISAYIFGLLAESSHKEFYSDQNLSNIFIQGFNEYLYSGTTYNTINSASQQYQNSLIQNGIMSLLTFVLFLPFLVVLVSCAVRRLHDIGTFGWWIVIVAIPLWLFFDLWIVIAPILFLIFKDGQRHYNRYGQDPKNPEAPIPLEIPKENQNIRNFEAKFLDIVEKGKEIILPHLVKIKSKFKKEK